ncbi:hypothetical protein [Amycolatopsis sp. NPDC058986]|uniref:hypothetical protein n=1 Tax=unclassified Amycolatopsis TaxID=2618356 RepID=UPI003670A4BD
MAAATIDPPTTTDDTSQAEPLLLPVPTVPVCEYICPLTKTTECPSSGTEKCTGC